MSAYKFNGPISLAFRDFVVPKSMLGETELSLESTTRERTTQGGTFTEPTGTFETQEFSVTLFAPSLNWFIQNFLKTGGEEGTEGQFNFVNNADECVPVEVGPLNIHPHCETNDANDVHFYNAQMGWNVGATLSDSDPAEIELTFYANPDDDGNVWRLGTGDLTQESEWDADSQETVPVTS